jgi:hypothetical protein
MSQILRPAVQTLAGAVMGAAGMTQGYSCIWRSFEDICSGYHQFGDELKVKGEASSTNLSQSGKKGG